MGKKKKAVRARAEAAVKELKRRYSVGQLLLANTVAWALFLLLALIVEKAYPAVPGHSHGAYVLGFYAFVGIGVTIGSFLDYALDRNSTEKRQG